MTMTVQTKFRCIEGVLPAVNHGLEVTASLYECGDQFVLAVNDDFLIVFETGAAFILAPGLIKASLRPLEEIDPARRVVPQSVTARFIWAARRVHQRGERTATIRRKELSPGEAIVELVLEDFDMTYTLEFDVAKSFGLGYLIENKTRDFVSYETRMFQLQSLTGRKVKFGFSNMRRRNPVSC